MRYYIHSSRERYILVEIRKILVEIRYMPVEVRYIPVEVIFTPEEIRYISQYRDTIYSTAEIIFIPQ